MSTASSHLQQTANRPQRFWLYTSEQVRLMITTRRRKSFKDPDIKLHSKGSQNGHREGCGWPGSLTLLFSFLCQLCFFVHYHPCDRHIRVLLSGFPDGLSQRLPRSEEQQSSAEYLVLPKDGRIHEPSSTRQKVQPNCSCGLHLQ